MSSAIIVVPILMIVLTVTLHVIKYNARKKQ